MHITNKPGRNLKTEAFECNGSSFTCGILEETYARCRKEKGK